MFIESKVSKIVEGKKTTTRDIIALEEATTESSVKLYTSSAHANKQLNNALGIFGTIDNILANAEKNIAKVRNSRKEQLGKDSWVYATIQKILRFMIGKPLVQIAVLSVSAYGSYRLMVGLLSIVRSLRKNLYNVFKAAVGGFASLVTVQNNRQRNTQDLGGFTPSMVLKTQNDAPNDVDPYKEVYVQTQTRGLKEFKKFYEQNMEKITVTNVADLREKGVIQQLNTMMEWNSSMKAPVPKSGKIFSIKYTGSKPKEMLCIDGKTIAGYEHMPRRFKQGIAIALGGASATKSSYAHKTAKTYGPHKLPTEKVVGDPGAQRTGRLKHLYNKIFTFDEPIRFFDAPRNFKRAPDGYWKNAQIEVDAGTRIQLIDSNRSAKWVLFYLPDTGEFAYQTLNFMFSPENTDLFGNIPRYNPGKESGKGGTRTKNKKPTSKKRKPKRKGRQ